MSKQLLIQNDSPLNEPLLRGYADEKERKRNPKTLSF